MVFACSSGEAYMCRVNADCASGVCEMNGRCLIFGHDGGLPGGDVTGTDIGVDQAGSGGQDADHLGIDMPSAGADMTGPPPPAPDAMSMSCRPNNDDTISRDEVPLQAGLHATFRVAESVAVDTTGMMQPDGSRVWDFSGSYSGDHSELIETTSIDGTWFAPDFNGATYS